MLVMGVPIHECAEELVIQNAPVILCRQLLLFHWMCFDETTTYTFVLFFLEILPVTTTCNKQFSLLGIQPVSLPHILILINTYDV